MATETTEKAKRTRTLAPAEYCVERICADSTEREPECWCACAQGFADTAAGMRWIKKNGEPYKTYRVVRVCAGRIAVTVEKVEKRTLA